MLETRLSVCALDCPDTCSALVDIEDGRGVRLRGNPAHPVTRGFLCGKVTRYLERVNSPARLLHPMRRVGAKGEGRFERVSWDSALDEIASRLGEIAAQHGPEAILPYSYAGTMGLLNGSGMDRRFFHRLGASQLDRTICSEAGTEGLMAAQGVRYGMEMEQFANARLIIAWGANVLETNVHLWPFIAEARRKGARFYVIDPRRSRTAEAADKHFAIHPGSDAALALAMMRVIIGEGLHDAGYVALHTVGFEELRERVREWTPERAAALTGLDAGEIAALAREYATLQPSAIRLNYGVQRSERGAMAVRCIALLPALTGAWRTAGGGAQLSTSQAFRLNREALEMPGLQQAALGRPARLVNMTQLGAALTELDNPPVKALVVYNSNPAAIAPDQNAVLRGLAREDLFTVTLEQFQTDTADYSDFVLPATTFLEHADLYLSYGHYYLQWARPALEAPGEARSNVWVFRQLAARMGFAEPCFEDSEEAMARTALDSPHPFLKGITFEQLDRDGWARLNLPEPFLPFAAGGFGHPDGKCHFDAATLGYEPPVESRYGDAELRARFPLELITPKAAANMNATFGNRDDVDAAASALEIHPEDAAARGVAEGGAVRVFNARGEIFLRARISAAAQPGVVCAPAVRWPKRSPGRRGVNALTSQRLTDAGGSPVFYSCLVEVEKA